MDSKRSCWTRPRTISLHHEVQCNLLIRQREIIKWISPSKVPWRSKIRIPSFYRVPSRACWFNLEGRNSLNDPSSFAKVFIVFAWSSEVVWNFISLVLRIWLHSWSLGITFFTGKWIFKGGVPIHFEHVRILLGWVYVSWPDFLCWALGLHSRKMSTTPPIKQLRCQNTVEWGRCPYF